MPRWLIPHLFAVSLLAVAIIVGVLQGQRPRSQGLWVRVVTKECDSNEEIWSRGVILTVEEDGRTMINSEETSLGILPGRINDIFKTRGSRILFFDAANTVPYQQAITAIAAAQSATENLSVVVVTPSVRKQCDWRWAPIRDVLPGR